MHGPPEQTGLFYPSARDRHYDVSRIRSKHRALLSQLLSPSER